ncbi:MAG: hypothetical protein ACJAUP_001623 [Cellvibrionaceae bacterium]
METISPSISRLKPSGSQVFNVTDGFNDYSHSANYEISEPELVKVASKILTIKAKFIKAK